MKRRHKAVALAVLWPLLTFLSITASAQTSRGETARKEWSRFKYPKIVVVDSRKAYRLYRWNLEARSDPIFQIADLGMIGIE